LLESLIIYEGDERNYIGRAICLGKGAIRWSESVEIELGQLTENLLVTLVGEKGDAGVLVAPNTVHDDNRYQHAGSDHRIDLPEFAGVDTVKELKYRNPAKLAQAMAEANAKRKLVQLLPSEKRVAHWIDDARKLPPKISY